MSKKLIAITRELSKAVSALSFHEPVEYVYNPLEYAWNSHKSYLEKYGEGKGRVLLIGMNPGPWGMAQTGVPFGEVTNVRDFLGIEEEVRKPNPEHPKREIRGFDCPRSEVSGRRVWEWAKERYGSADNFFSKFFVLNYCPLCFMEEGGKNRTPDKLKPEERDAVFEVCDVALQKFVAVLEPSKANNAPTIAIPDIAFDPDMSGVCNWGGTLPISSAPAKVARTAINIRLIICSIMILHQ